MDQKPLMDVMRRDSLAKAAMIAHIRVNPSFFDDLDNAQDLYDLSAIAFYRMADSMEKARKGK